MAFSIFPYTRGLPGLLILPVLLSFSACEHTGLMKTPNIYVSSGRDPFSSLPPARQSVDVALVYATDREHQDDPDVRHGAGVQYGHGRSSSLAFGRATVALGEHVSWEELREASLTRRRNRRFVPALKETEELGRFPASQATWHVADGTWQRDPDVAEAAADVAGRLTSLLEEALATGERREAFVFVHGYNNQFYHAAQTMAQVWHFMGRPGVPVIYSWPAGRGGLRGYTSDTESALFTVFHFKQFLRVLAETPGLEKIHVLAHSRGTGVATSAIRELMLVNRAAGRDTREALKLGNLVLAAPDLSVDVVEQTLVSDGMIGVPERFTIYNSKGDRALLMSTWMMDSVKRLGNLAFDPFLPEKAPAIASMPLLTFIDARVESDITGHAYFWTNPAASSDLILLLRDNKEPGAEHGRPLTREAENYWILRDSYLLRPPAPASLHEGQE